MRQQPIHRTMWACAFDFKDQPYVIEVAVLESKKVFTIDEKLVTKSELGRIGAAVGFRKRVEKDCQILFDTREAAIKGKISFLTDRHEGLLKKAHQVLQQIEALRGIL